MRSQSIVPKETKASSLRTSQNGLPTLPTPNVRRQSYTTAERAALFGSLSGSSSRATSDNATAGHSRRSSLASLQAPCMAPRVNKASLLRSGTGAQVLTTSERATSAKGHSRTSTASMSTVDVGSSTSSCVRAPLPRSPSAVSQVSPASSRPTSGLATRTSPVQVASQPSRKAAIVPGANKAAELRLAARRAAS